MTSLLLYIGSLIFLYTVALINLDYVSAYYAQAAGLDYGLSLSDNGFEVGLYKDAEISLCIFLNEFHV